VEWAITLAITTTRRIIEKDSSSSKFSDMLSPILQMIKEPEKENTPYTPPVGIDKSLFSDENDLDFFMYKHGVDI
jgi:hypothetical protein